MDFTPRRSPGLENYGWDIWEGSQPYEETPRGPGRLLSPVYEYSNGGSECSVTGGFVYRGARRPAERGRYIFGDYCSGKMWSFRISGGRATGLRVERFQLSGLSSFGQDLSGELYAVGHNGTIYRLT